MNYSALVQAEAADPDSSPILRPVIKWAGGKTRLLTELLSRVPRIESGARYVEPMLGGGALFLALQPASALLCDINADLIEMYTEIKRNPRIVYGCMIKLSCDHEWDPGPAYYAVRKAWNESRALWAAPRRAATFIYLNRACFNGLYRVNSQGHFNVPIGDYDLHMPSLEHLCDVSEALRGQELWAIDAMRMRDVINPGDFVYLDPPYIPASATSNFTAYSAGGFSDQDQVRLEQFARALVYREVMVMISQSDTLRSREIFADPAWKLHEVSAARSISANGAKRGKAAELIITGGY